METYYPQGAIVVLDHDPYGAKSSRPALVSSDDNHPDRYDETVEDPAYTAVLLTTFFSERVPPFIDILPRLQSWDSHRTARGFVGSLRFVHRRELAVPSDRYSYPAVGSRFCPADSELTWLVRVGIHPRSTGHGMGGPILSDCPGMGADMPRRVVGETTPTDIKIMERTGFIPRLNEAVGFLPAPV